MKKLIHLLRALAGINTAALQLGFRAAAQP
jgi:hypothetical protein